MIRQGLILPEFLCKYASVPAGILAFGSEGNFLEKAASGVTKLYTGPSDAMGNYDTFRQASQDFNSLTAREFYEKHGADAGNYLLDLADRAVQFGNQVASNFQDQPIETIIAKVIATEGL